MRRTITALVLAAALLGGCGGDDEDEPAATPEATAEATQEPAGGGGGGETVAVASPEDGGLSFEPAELTAPAGEVTFTYDNPSMVPHAFDIEDVEGSETETITQSEESVTVQLEPGEYTFYCPVGSHRQAGMEGTLTVE